MTNIEIANKIISIYHQNNKDVYTETLDKILDEVKNDWLEPYIKILEKMKDEHFKLKYEVGRLFDHTNSLQSELNDIKQNY
jgi:hypothetical protein